MKDLVKQFVRLQAFDNKLNSLKMQKGDLPIVIETLGDDLKEKKDRSAEIEATVEKLSSDRRMFEKEIEASKSFLKKYEDQLYNVQNNKEYDAISAEIEAKKQEVENLESKIIQTIEDEEELTSELKVIKEEVGKLGSELTENQKELEEITLQTQAEEDQLIGERDDIAKLIEPRYLSQYERIRKAKSGLAVANVSRNSCGGCFSAIPPQKLVEIRANNSMKHCEYCGRILVWVEVEQPV